MTVMTDDSRNHVPTWTTFFARHGSQLAIDKETYEALWTENRVGIHFPKDKRGWPADQDSRSIEPNDYSSTAAKRALNALLELSRDGGYVCGVYDPYPGCKLGFVEPNSTIELLEGRWSKDTAPDRIAILKTLRLSRVKVLDASESISLLVAQPRQGTFCRWWKIGSRVQYKVDGTTREISLDDLTPDLQEVMCSEFLRSKEAAKLGLPRIEALLLPVGRTMKDIDILGIDDNGNKVVVQVTYSHSDDVGRKQEALRRYVEGRRNTRAVMFCDTSKATLRGDIHAFPIREVFRAFCEQSPLGKRWLSSVL